MGINRIWARTQSTKGALMAAVLSLLLAAGAAVFAVFPSLAQQSPAKKEAPSVQVSSVASAAPVAPIGIDEAFAEALGDYQMLSGEIARIEKATGTVEIPVSLADLRHRAEMKLGRLRAWMKDHKVGDDWRYDATARAFFPPAPAAPKPEEKKP
jgi:hypothetical protein